MSARSSGVGRPADGSMDRWMCRICRVCWIHRSIERSTHCSIYRSTSPIRPYRPTMVVVGSWSVRGQIVVVVGSWLARGRPDSTRLQIGVVVVVSRHDLNKLTFFVMVSTRYEPSAAGLTITTTIVCLLNKQECKETETSMREMLTL